MLWQSSGVNMSDRDARGLFIKGNQIAKNKASSFELKLRKEDRRIIIGLIRKYAFMTISELRRCTENLDALMVIEGLIVKHYVDSLAKGDLNFLKLILNYLGIVEIKAMAIQEVDKLQDDSDEDIKDLNLSKDEKLYMLNKYKEIIESE